MDDQDAIRNASQAQRELQLTEKAFDNMKASAIQALIDSGPLDTDKREECYRLVKVIEKVRQTLRHQIDAGKVAEKLAQQG